MSLTVQPTWVLNKDHGCKEFVTGALIYQSSPVACQFVILWGDWVLFTYILTTYITISNIKLYIYNCTAVARYETANPFPSSNGCIVWKWASNLTLYVMIDVLIYRCWHYISTVLVKGDLWIILGGDSRNSRCHLYWKQPFGNCSWLNAESSNLFSDLSVSGSSFDISYNRLHSLKPSDASVRQEIIISLVQIMACRLFGAIWEQSSVKFE